MSNLANILVHSAKRHYRFVGAIIGVVTTIAFVVYIIRALRGYDLSVYTTPKAVVSIVLSAVIYSACVPFTAAGWKTLLRGVGVQQSWRLLAAILGITQIAKYVPGNVAQYLGRAGLSLSRGIDAPAFAVTVMLEMLLTVAAALIIGVGAGMFSQIGLVMIRSKIWQLVAIVGVLLIVAIGLLMFCVFAPRLLRRLAPKQAHYFDRRLLPSLLPTAQALLFYCGAVLCIGFAMIVLAHSLLSHAPHEDWLLLACLALAWVIGFVTPGAPAGLGVREGLLLLMLAPVYGTTLAGVLIIALRLTTTLGDIFCFIGGLLLLPRSSPSPPTALTA